MRRIPKRWVALVVAGVAAATVAATRLGPTHHTAHQDTGPPPPLTQQAYALARQEFGLLSGGDWSGAWSLWSPEAQRAVPLADFLRVNTTCRADLGQPYVIDSGTTTTPTTVTFTWHHTTTKGTSTVHYAAGHWKFTPDPTTLAPYAHGPDALIHQRRTAGTCD